MLFDFELFKALVARAYKNVGSAYSLEEVIEVFRYYFQQYEGTFREVHPSIRMAQIERIIETMPFIDSSSYGNQISDIAADSYEALIDQHFKTKYRNCDYNINHFFAGDIRLMRFYEVCY